MRGQHIDVRTILRARRRRGQKQRGGPRAFQPMLDLAAGGGDPEEQMTFVKRFSLEHAPLVEEELRDLWMF